MANLDDLCTWEKYVPTLGANRTLERPFYLLIRCGMSILEYDAFMTKWSATETTAEAMAPVCSEMVRMGPEPLIINGSLVADLKGYLEFILGRKGTPQYTELLGAIVAHNSVGGQAALFSERLSGGGVSTVVGGPPAAEDARH